ncbi:ATP synthase subunit I [Roseibium aggregatum]|uniref:ATP synthase subunit I n=1 Tax=Roseibium aggregatum TaxID=187304 RepID=A0A939EDX6_9HYPH|nr:ATP synthase subunit I [Roseibium aggregatum]MBN9671375.1 hypothetical protein [Roseibium aggregatum]
MMSLFAMLQSLPPAATALFGLVLGFALGLIHFASLRRVVDLYTGAAPVARALILHIARFVLVIAGLGLLAFLGALPLLAGALGILLARAAVLRLTREAS